MKSTIVLALGLGAAASAIVPHKLPSGAQDTEVWFKLTGYTHISTKGLPVVQLGDGQNRLGAELPLGEYRIKDGRIWDEHHRGCILTPPTTQWQCDEGAEPTDGFDIDCEGELTHKGSKIFYVCPVDDHGVWNIYKYGAPNQLKCTTATIKVSGGAKHITEACSPNPIPPAKPSPPAKPTPPAKPSPPVQLTPPGTQIEHHSSKGNWTCNGQTSDTGCYFNNKGGFCPMDLNGEYEFPHYIARVHHGAKGYHVEQESSLNGTVGPHMCSLFTFDIHPKHAGKKCSVLFLFPNKSELVTSSYEMTGYGFVHFNQEQVEHPTVVPEYGPEFRWTEGVSHAIYTTDSCPVGKKVQIKMCSSGSLQFNYFQDFNPSPIGLYVRVC